MPSSKNKTIGGALTTECEGNVSGRAGVIRGAQPDPHQAQPEGVSGSQAGSRSKATVDLHEVQIENQFPREAQGNYVVDGAIDTHLLGMEVLGTQRGKGGPGALKFRCAQCRKKKWMINSEVESASELHRFTKCMDCVTSIKEERARKALESKIDNKMKEQWDSVTSRLSSLERENQNLRIIIEKQVEEMTALRASFVALQEDLRNRSPASPQPSLRAMSVSLSPLSGTGSPDLARGNGECERVIDDAFRSVSMQGLQRQVEEQTGRRAPQYSEIAAKQPAPPQRTRVYSSSKENNAIPPPRKAEKTKKTGKNLGYPPPGDQPKKGNPPPGDRPKKRKRKRRSQLQRSAVEQGCACQCQRTPNLLLGDSLVGGMTGRVFSQLQTPNTVRAIPGAKIRRLIEEVVSLNLKRDSTLLLSVGGNDVFPKNARHGPTEAIVRDLDHLLEMAKSKVNRCVVVGILPRKYRTNDIYSRALGVNRRLAALCNKYSFRFVDPWTAFYGRDVLFQTREMVSTFPPVEHGPLPSSSIPGFLSL